MGYVGSAAFLIAILFPPFPFFFLIRAFVLSPAHTELPELQAHLRLPRRQELAESQDSLSLQWSGGARRGSLSVFLTENTGIFLL